MAHGAHLVDHVEFLQPRQRVAAGKIIGIDDPADMLSGNVRQGALPFADAPIGDPKPRVAQRIGERGGAGLGQAKVDDPWAGHFSPISARTCASAAESGLASRSCACIAR